jgi:hypothetical protein
LLQVVARIESFPVTSPLMKFLFGMEMLLEKAQVGPGFQVSKEPR